MQCLCHLREKGRGKNQHCMPRHVSILVSLVESPCIHLFFSGVPTRARMSGTQCSHQQTLHTSCTHSGYILFHLLPTGSQIFKREVPPGKIPNGRRSAKWNLSVYLVKAAGCRASAETTGNDVVKRLRYNTIICIGNCQDWSRHQRNLVFTFLSYVVLGKPYAVDVTLTSSQQKPKEKKKKNEKKERERKKKKRKKTNSSVIRWNGHCNIVYAKATKMKNIHRVTGPKNLNI